MSIDLIAGKLSRLGLLGLDGEGIAPSISGLFVYFSDGSDGFYTDAKQAWSNLRDLKECTHEEFWARGWLKAPSYDSLAEVWDILDTPQIEAAERLPRSSEFATIGRLRRFGAKQYLLQTDNGDYAVIDEKQATKWRLTPLE